MERAPPLRVAPARGCCGRQSYRLTRVRGWETRSLPGGADYRQLLLLSPATIGLPQPTASPRARPPPAPPFPSPPPRPLRRPRRVCATVALSRAQVPGSRMGEGEGEQMSPGDREAGSPPGEGRARRCGGEIARPQAGRAPG